MAGTPQTLILVVGMHRSGTSLLGSLLPQVGVPVPGELIDADHHNPEGYFERSDITALQEQLLLDLDRWWPSQKGVLPLPLNWRDHPASEQTVEQLHALLAGEMARHSGPWAIKDPRTSLLLPLWRRVAHDLGLPLKVVLCLRDPREVSTSLLRRDRLSAGMTAWRAQQLWWRHTLQALLDSQGLPLHPLHYGRWFEPSGQGGPERQLQELVRFCRGTDPSPEETRLALTQVRPEHRRSLRSLQRLVPIHPRLRRLERQLLAVADGQLERGALEAELASAPLPIALPLAALRHGPGAGAIAGAPGDDTGPDPASHPWGAAALALHGQHQALGRRQLENWCQWSGPTTIDQAYLAAAPASAFPLLQSPPDAGAATTPDRPAAGRILAWGRDWTSWPLQAWLQHLPLALHPRTWELLQGLEPLELPAADSPERRGWLGIHLQSLEESTAQGQLERLTRLELVFDPDPTQVGLLRRLGVRACRLTTGQTNGWLDQPGDGEAIAQQLGLPAPESLTGVGGQLLCLGSGGEDWERQLQPPCWGLPGFDRLRLDGPEQARLLAAWLQACNTIGLQLVRFHPSREELDLWGWTLLRPPDAPPAGWLPPQTFLGEISIPSLQAELAWRQAGCPAPEPCQTPTPAAESLWEQGDGLGEAAVCISLHNYGDRIEAALDSVRQQSLVALELVVVDDASSDGGERRVLAWLERHGQRFTRSLLLRHPGNAGLAAARNTAFAAARSPWCFVLDADNTLLPEAVTQCLRVARSAPATAGVVHPLVEVVPEETVLGRSSAIEPLSWQRNHFLATNVIDAMALVRRQAWAQVGGYTHIPGGWEDYDFWCQLIDAGFHGVLCPQRLARYHCHGHSMLATKTHLEVRRLSRLLQARHPWLRLPMAESGA
ncbi:glycosyltransferase [Synechococcus sp. GreenBA-s]|nr:glycosyltransferase [Synechococcus sp. GreenBA-s]